MAILMSKNQEQKFASNFVFSMKFLADPLSWIFSAEALRVDARLVIAIAGDGILFR